MNNVKTYQGIEKDPNGGMTPTGNIVRDAWVFEIIPEAETCAGWSMQDMNALYDKVTEAWAPYGHLASQLPSPLRERHERIYAEAVQRARAEGWTPELGEND